MTTEAGDVRLFNTTDGGEIIVENGLAELSGGLETAAYLSLFGGNVDDPGDNASLKQWWGNFDETDPARRYRSRTQHLLKGLPATPFNLRRIEQEAKNDLAWFVSEGVATSVEVEASLESRDRVRIVVTILADESQTVLTYSANWRAEF